MTIEAKLTAFIEKYRLTAYQIDCDELIDNFLLEMKTGLSGEGSSLAMIPTFVSCPDHLPVNEPVIVLDAGGTNLRVCTVTFRDDAPPLIENFQKHRMPGLDKELSKSAFYSILVQYLSDFSSVSDRVGFCFSYPSEISPNRDGRLLRWTKEVQIPELVGDYLGAGLVDAMAAAGYGQKEVVILNDTVAALLAGHVEGEKHQCADYVGFILGTGTNTAYIEGNRNITKRDDLDSHGSMVINLESGNFDKVPRGELDILLDKSTNNPGQQVFEKMISGAYLGPLGLCTLKAAADEALLSETASRLFRQWDELSTVDMDNYMENPDIKDSPFYCDAINAADKRVISDLFASIIARAALLTAVNIATPIIKSGSGTSPNHPVGVNIDGSTFHKMTGLSELAYGHLDRILACRGIHYLPFHTENAPVLGAAIAALS